MLEYAYQHHEEFPDASIYWIHASNALRFEQGYLRIARNANLPGLNDPDKDTKKLTKNWLESKESGTWLMIVDNADDAEVFFGAPKDDDSAASTRLAEFLPQSSNGSIVFTTRNNKAGVRLAGTSGIIFLPEMDVMDGHNLVKARLGSDFSDESPVTELLQLLGYLPLAISQATAYIAENLISITEYIEMYNESEASKIDLLSQDFEDLARESGSRNPVATTWLISIDQIQKLDSLAVDVLSYMACLDRQGIPKALLPPSKGPVKLANALGLLKAYSLITGGQTNKGFDMHPLVYLATRNWLRLTGKFEYWVEICSSLVAEVFPTGEHNTLITCDLYLSHAQVLLGYEWLLMAGNIDRALLAYKVSRYQKSRGKYNSAETLATQALEAREKALGPEHLDTLTSIDNLALVLVEQAKYETAQELHYRALVGRERALGREHLDTLTSVDNLAWVLERQDKLEAAEAMTRQALEGREKALGKEHPDTLTSMDNLAWVLSKQNKDERAEEIAQQTLEGRSKVLGKEHPLTLTSMNSLARILSSQSKHEAAEEVHRRAIEGREKVLGKEHPGTLTSVDNLAYTLSGQGKHEAAEEMYRQVLEGRQKVLGKEHPDTLASAHNLAWTLNEQGKHEAAKALYQQALEGRQKVLGNEHPDTLASASSLAWTLNKQGKHEAAEALYQQALEGRQKVLGKEHPDTLASAHNLAWTLNEQGKHEAAKALYQQALEGRQKVLGNEHPDTLASASSLAWTLNEQGKHEAAEALCQHALEWR